MGLAATQARFLQLTARKSNNEYQAQQINQQRMNLAEYQEQFTKEYLEKTNNRIMFFVKDPLAANTLGNMKQLTYWDIVTPAGDTAPNGNTMCLGYRLVDKNGDIVVPNYPANSPILVDKYHVTDEVKDNSILQNNIKDGTWVMKAKRTDADGVERWFEIPYNEATFITEMRAENPDDETDKEYFRLFNTNVPQIDGKYQELSFENLTTMKDLQIQIYDADGKILTDKIPENDVSNVAEIYNVDPKCIDSKYLEEKLRNGEWFIQQPTGGEDSEVSWLTVPWTGVDNIYDAYDSEDDAAAEAEYQYLLSQFQKQDKMLQLELERLETENKSITNELEGITKTLENNISSSFKTFA